MHCLALRFGNVSKYKVNPQRTKSDPYKIGIANTGYAEVTSKLLPCEKCSKLRPCKVTTVGRLVDKDNPPLTSYIFSRKEHIKPAQALCVRENFQNLLKILNSQPSKLMKLGCC